MTLSILKTFWSVLVLIAAAAAFVFFSLKAASRAWTRWLETGRPTRLRGGHPRWQQPHPGMK